ncbi:MAG: hypothetical protein KF810_02950 [Rhizobiaceae bacterium]|nr:hypothetical protein [Rhizobiaceae bacterium]
MAFPSELEDLLDEGRVAIRQLVTYQLGSGTYGFWTGVGTLTIGEIDYVQNHIMTISEPVQATGSAAAVFTIEMPEKPDFEITPDLLTGIENEDYKNKPVVISDAYFDPDTRALLHVEPMVAGYVDTIDHTVDDNGAFTLIVNCMTRAIDNHRDGYRAANHEDQQLVSPGDTFFLHAGRVKNEYFDIRFD